MVDLDILVVFDFDKTRNRTTSITPIGSGSS